MGWTFDEKKAKGGMGVQNLGSQVWLGRVWWTNHMLHMFMFMCTLYTYNQIGDNELAGQYTNRQTNQQWKCVCILYIYIYIYILYIHILYTHIHV